jgi:TPR repeat protein
MSSPQSYAEWDEEQMASELEAAAAFGSADSYAQRRLGYRKLLGRWVAPADGAVLVNSVCGGA